MTVFLKFPIESDARRALSPWMIDEEDAWPVYLDRAAVDVVGIVSVPTGETALDESGEPYPLYTPLPGFHVNLSRSVPELSGWEIEVPTTPARVFASQMPEPLRVPTEVARWQAKLALMRSTDGEGVPLWERMLQLRSTINDTENAVLMDAALHETLNWRRASPTVEWAAGQLNLTAEQVDQLFIQAAALEL